MQHRCCRSSYTHRYLQLWISGKPGRTKGMTCFFFGTITLPACVELLKTRCVRGGSMEEPQSSPTAPTREDLQSRRPPPRPLKHYEAFGLRPRQNNITTLGLVSTDVLHFFVLVVDLLVLSTIGGIPCASLGSSTAESWGMPPPECRLFFVSPGGLYGSV